VIRRLRALAQHSLRKALVSRLAFASIAGEGQPCSVWGAPIPVVRVVVVDIARRVDVEHVVGVAAIRTPQPNVLCNSAVPLLHVLVTFVVRFLPLPQ
jgi:hypothetical protein